MSGLILPDGAGFDSPGGPLLCRVCEARFRKVGEWERHVGACARANMDRLVAQRLESRVPMLEHPDPEVEEHMLGVWKRMLAEGRLVVKPSERAGFS